MLNVLLSVILLVFGVLQIILFFKLWGMTNDIREIKNKYVGGQTEETAPDEEPVIRISKTSKPTI